MTRHLRARIEHGWGGLLLCLLLGTACSEETQPSEPSASPSAGSSSTTPPPASAGSAAAAGSSAAGTTAAPAPAGSAAPAPAGSAAPIAGGPATDPLANNTAGGAAPVAGAAAPVAGTGAPVPRKPAMDECGLKTKFDGDNYCINAPPADKGFQLHIGPSNYDNPEPQYILQPGEETTNNFPATSTNEEKIFFYFREFRMRPGAHHNIISTSGAGAMAGLPGGAGLDLEGGLGRRIGTTNHLVEDSPKGGIIAPENEGVGIPLDAKARLNVSLHSINTSDKPQLREMWVNFWYRDPSLVKEPAEQMFQTGSVTFAVQPHEDTVLGPFKCTIRGDGRMLWFYGHRHANNTRFSAWRIRGGQRDLFYEGFNWEEPMVLEYASTVTNVTPDRDKQIEGGWNGVLDMKAGDVLEWECHIVNKTNGVLRFSNNTYTGEMCIMDAELVGANCP